MLNLIGAVRAAKLLNGFVSRPGQLYGQVHSPPLVLSFSRGMQRDTSGGSIRDNGHKLLPSHEQCCNSIKSGVGDSAIAWRSDNMRNVLACTQAGT